MTDKTIFILCKEPNCFAEHELYIEDDEAYTIAYCMHLPIGAINFD